MCQTSNYIRDNVVKIVDKKGNFYGTGFFIDIDNKKYCITCHHCIFKLDEIYVERNTVRYEALWVEKYSNMDKDIAILDVKNCPHKSLSYFKETLPGIEVSIWGFPRRDIEHLPEGRSVEKIRIGEIPVSFIWKGEKLENGVNKWNKKPDVKIESFHVEGRFEIGFSGSPVYYSVTKQVVGMLAAKDDKNGYLIPIQTILEKFEFYEHTYILKDKKVMDYSLTFMDGVKQKMDICFDHNAPYFIVSDDYPYKNAYEILRKQKKAKIRAITDIRQNNKVECKKLEGMVDELRHLNGIEGGIAVSEDQYMTATISLLQNLSSIKNIESPMSDAVYSKRKEVVTHNQYIFNTFWENAIPADIRFQELDKT